MSEPVGYGQALAAALIQAMRADPRVFVYGEGINDPGGFFGSTVGVAAAVGTERCFDVPNSEETLVGMAVGAALLGARPVMVNLRIEFLLLAANQIINHAAKWAAMTNGVAKVPIVLRAMIGKHWGQAAQHSGALYPIFAHVPGLQVVVPGSFEDGPGLLLSAIASDEPTLIVEEKPIYDLRGPLDERIAPVPLGKARVVRPGDDLTIVAVASGVQLAVRAAERLSAYGIQAAVIDPRTIVPLDEETILKSVRKTRRLAVIDVAWPRFGLAAELARIVLTRSADPLRAPLLQIGPPDSHAPASCFLDHEYYPKLDDVVTRLRALFGKGPA